MKKNPGYQVDEAAAVSRMASPGFVPTAVQENISELSVQVLC